MSIVDCINSADSSSPVVQKSANDLREYKVMRLCNRMKVLLISDPETDKSAVCLSVNIGSLSDPKELPGLAHFCEHMLFLGTKSFPTENTYLKYITDHGGHCNAFTSPDKTSYVFDVAPESLRGALDIFSQFFVCPLFTDSATEREISFNMVTEHGKCLFVVNRKLFQYCNNDFCFNAHVFSEKYMLQKDCGGYRTFCEVSAVQSEHEKDSSNDTRRLFQLERNLSKGGHDYTKFFSGNRYSLFESSCAKSVNTREKLLQFYSTWYSSNLMSLVILGRESINDLQKLAEDKFSEVIDRNVVQPSWNDTPWPDICLKKMVYVVPLNDIHQMNIMWPIPDYIPDYTAQATSYVTYLLGHESRGSLLSLFKNASWVNQLTCDVNRQEAGICYLNVFVHLTLKGLEKINEIITNIYQYINMLRSDEPKRWIFDEIQTYNMQDVLTSPLLATVYNPNLIKKLLTSLNPDNSRIFVLSKTFTDKCVEEEPWYYTKYLATDIPESTLSVWRNSSTNPELRFPEPNPFIATEFDLVQNKYPTNAEIPELLIETDMSRIWYFQDREFNLPKGFIKFHIVSLSTFCSPLHETLCAFYRYHGFTYKLKSVVQEIVAQLVNYCEPKTDRFEFIREKISQNITNFSAKPSHYQACTYLTNITLHHSWINDDFIQALQDITYEKLVNYIKEFFELIFIEGLIYGNITEVDAINYYEMVRDLLIQKFSSKPLLLSHITTPREVIIPEGSSFLYQRYISGQPASAIYYYLQCGEQSTLNNTLLHLFYQIVRGPTFDKLYTEQQLGLIVQAGLRRSNKLQGFRILVQSTYHPNKIDKCIEEFLLTVNKLLEDMSDEEFNVHVQSLLTHLLEKPKGMQDRFGRLWSEIACRHYNFKRQVY
uniref:Insulin-degrading enzyme n=1 Tax=Schistosoma mansoni TaxID=6183 RepID=A0A5K4FBS3_SCHMA